MMQNSLLKNLKVLYVEDEYEVVEQMEFLLKKRVGKLITAQNGREGIDKFKESLPDMIISDLQMPVMDGIAMASEIRKTSDVPIIITTAFSESEIILKAVDVGIEKYLVKPINARELISTMEEVARKDLRKKGEILAFGDMFFSKEEKLEIEEKIRNGISKFIKDKTGKGPKNVKAFIHGKIIEIDIFEAFTKMEKSLLENINNVSSVKYQREVLYKNFERDMGDIIKEYINVNTKLNKVEININDDRNGLEFLITEV